MIIIENTSKQKKVWTLSALNKVTLETFVEARVQQLWKQGEPDAEGFITLEKYTVEDSNSFPVLQVVKKNVITALSASVIDLEIKGNIALRWITS